MAKRGRPYGQMTSRRRQVLEEIKRTVEQTGERPPVRTLARRLCIHEPVTLRRIMRDLEEMGHLV